MTEKIQNIAIIVLLTSLLAVQMYLLFRQLNLKRKPAKVILNLLLWISLVILIFPPTTKNNENLDQIGIKDNTVPTEFISRIKDSLKLKKVVSIGEYEKEYADKNLETKLLGQTFNGEFLSNFSDKKVSFHPYFEEDELQNLNWRAVLHQNETQEIRGAIELGKVSILKLKFGNKTLDSMKLDKGKQQFYLSYPSFSLGKTNVTLYLDEKPISELKYYSRNSPKLRILVLAENPDFETKMLSEWLGKNGHSVEVETAVTKNTQNKTKINESKKGNFDVVFTNPSRANNLACQKTLKEGGGVFVFNVLETDIAEINKSLGSSFGIQRISAETEVKLSNDLVSLPFKIKENKNQQSLKNWPISISNKKTGISLISETFPLLLSGDSITYRKIWGGVLQLLQPIQKNNIEIEAPVLQDLNTEIRFNNFENPQEVFAMKNDSIFSKNSPINENTYIGNYVFRNPGWQILNDSMEVFVNDVSEGYAHFQLTKTVLNSYSKKTNSIKANTNFESSLLPDWLRLLFCIVLFILVWLEAKW